MIGNKQFLDDVDPYVADFEEVLRVVELSSGFVLLPIGVPGPDLAEMLATWLTRKKHSTVVSIPDGDAEWKNIGAWLLEVKPEENGVVFVIGNSEAPENFSLAMRLVNERRDAIAKHLDCPLLWCGPKEFLLATAEHAPDFWSVRAVERYIKAAKRKPRSFHAPKASAERRIQKNELLQDAIRQGDRQSTEIIFLSQLRQAMADESGHEFDSLLKSIPAGLERTDKKYRIELGLMRAEMARRSGKISEAIEILDALDEHFEKSDEECRVELLRGRVWEKAGDVSKAKSAYDDAKDAARHANAELLYLLGCIYSDALEPQSKGYKSHLREHCQAAREANDRPLEAFTLALLVIATTHKYDRRHAQRLLREATSLHESSKDDESILFPGEVDEALRRAAEAIEEGADASPPPNDEKVQETIPTTTIAEHVKHPPTRSRREFLGLFIVMFLILIGYFVFSSTSRDKVHCFRGANDKIICGESLEHCEKLRAIEGNANASACQKPQFGKSD